MKRIIALLLTGTLLLTGCSGHASSNYSGVDSSFYYLEGVMDHKDRFAANLAVVPKISYLEEGFDKQVNSALLINNTDNEAKLAVNPHAKIYPASLTKLMTALIVMKYAKMDDIVTIKSPITFNESGVKICNLKQGDVISVRDLFNGLLVTSANDCGVALAEYISGNTQEFAKLMNKEAKALGATNSHFVNSHGLHNDNHYTTAYDLYLIFHEVCKYDDFLDTIKQEKYTMHYKNSTGTPLSQTIDTTNMYLNGTYTLPADVTMVGGKTGTTSLAGSCLIVLTTNKDKDQYISVITGATDKNILYDAMTDLLSRENQ